MNSGRQSENFKLKKLMAVIAVAIGATLFSCLAGASGLSVMPGAIKGFAMSSCREGGKSCLSVSADSAEGASLKRLFVLENPRLSVVASDSGKAQTEVWPKGYVDLDLNRLVVWRREGSRRIEKVYDF